MDGARSIRKTQMPPWRRPALVLSLLLAGHLGCQSVHTRPSDYSNYGFGVSQAVSAYTPAAKESSNAAENPVRQAQFVTSDQHAAEEPESALPMPREESRVEQTVIPPSAADTRISLEEALSLAGAENPTIALAQEAIEASLAERMQARALLFPTVTTGFNFRIHQGTLLTSSGIIRFVDSESLYAGLGASARGGETVGIPGIRIYAQLAEAAFAPRIARLRVQGRILDSAAVRNQVLLDVVERYYDLAGAEAGLLAIRQSEAELAEVVRVTDEFARAGQGQRPDADRALSEALLLHTEAQRFEEESAVASAQLARLLGTDPENRLHAGVESAAPIALINENDDLNQLVQTALANRPEVASAGVAIREAQTRLRQERARPLLPLISAGLSLGTFGGGSDLVAYRFDHFGGRTDFDVLAVWSLQNFGLGNRAVNNRVRSEINQAFAEQDRVINRVRDEVAEAYGLIADRRREVEVARQRVRISQRGFQEELERSKHLQGRPIEVLHSLNQLIAARQAFVQASVRLNQAQFRLFVALGQPPIPLAR